MADVNWEPAKQNWRTIFAVTWALLALYFLWGWSNDGRYTTRDLSGYHFVVDTRTGPLYSAPEKIVKRRKQ